MKTTWYKHHSPLVFDMQHCRNMLHRISKRAVRTAVTTRVLALTADTSLQVCCETDCTRTFTLRLCLNFGSWKKNLHILQKKRNHPQMKRKANGNSRLHVNAATSGGKHSRVTVPRTFWPNHKQIENKIQMIERKQRVVSVYSPEQAIDIQCHREAYTSSSLDLLCLKQQTARKNRNQACVKSFPGLTLQSWREKMFWTCV